MIGIIFIFIQCKAAVGAGIDTQFQWIGRFFRGVLDEWTHRNDGTCFDKKRAWFQSVHRQQCSVLREWMSRSRNHTMLSRRADRRCVSVVFVPE